MGWGEVRWKGFNGWANAVASARESEKNIWEKDLVSELSYKLWTKRCWKKSYERSKVEHLNRYLLKYVVFFDIIALIWEWVAAGAAVIWQGLLPPPFLFSFLLSLCLTTIALFFLYSISTFFLMSSILKGVWACRVGGRSSGTSKQQVARGIWKWNRLWWQERHKNRDDSTFFWWD